MRHLYYSISIYLLRTYSILKFFVGIIEQRCIGQGKAYGRSYREDEITDRPSCISYMGQGMGFPMPCHSFQCSVWKRPKHPPSFYTWMNRVSLYFLVLSISLGIIWHCAHTSYSVMTSLMHGRSWSWMSKAESGSSLLVLLGTKRAIELQILSSTLETPSFPPWHCHIGLHIFCRQKMLISFFLSESESEDNWDCIWHGNASSEHLYIWALYTAVASHYIVEPTKAVREGADALRGMT